ncbi:MAG: type II CRISPR RNA-guided endonuclease Cas9 [Calditrichaceae bacterium]|nr:type II CRISPR RNA-guided endonuclease Cas9 [Calditrichaceae bacterium]
MGKILGLDLGTNSIGWAIIEDKEKKIIGMGSRIFHEGVVDLGMGQREISKNASRTNARGIRRQIFRKKIRKLYLLKILSKNKLCPLDTNEVKTSNSEIFKNKELTEWFKINPYELRAKAVNEKIELNELGRIFYHMIQRRGFQSNSRSAGKEEGKIYEGDDKEGKIGIIKTQEKISNNTLGTYLYSLYPAENYPFKNRNERIRNRYTTRKMYIDEFETIWERQKQYHPELTTELKTLIGGRKKDGYPEDGVLFHQRPLRSQKYLIGKCTFEHKKTKCPKSAIPFELFRIHQWVNTIEYNDKKLSEEEREKVVNLLLRSEKIEFKKIRKAINKLDSYYQFNYKDDDKIMGAHTISHLSSKKFFGEQWFAFPEKQQEEIWHVLFFFEDKDKLKQYAMSKWGFNEEQAEQISKFNLADGYANLSRKAINNILPFLKKGYTYDIAVALGGIKNAFNKKWNTLDDDHIRLIEDNVVSIVRGRWKGGFIEKLREFLKDEFELQEEELKKLYHHSSNIEVKTILEKLPTGKEADKEIQNIRNPVVIAALFELRKLINEIIDLYGKPDEIKIELARDLKISKTKRGEIRREQKRLEVENDRIKKELTNLGKEFTHDNILKYKLWEECNGTCPYTGRKIGLSQLFNGDVQIEHIHPWSRSLNDSFMNKTLCFADENRAKGDKTPYEYYFNEYGEEKWNLVKAQALSCFKNKPNYPNAYNKFKQFVKQTFDDDFISRQLNDTRYISREARTYLSKICDKVMVAPGQMTANLRQKWGLNSILSDEDKKTRGDHRHHAIDALVMACSTVSHLQELSRWNRYRRSSELKDFPMPWQTFLEEARYSVFNILVSHRKADIY